MRALIRLSCFVALSLMNWPALSRAADLPPNLVTNPSLEEKVGPEGLPQGWGGFFSQPAGKFQFALVAGGKTGKQALSIEGDGDFGVMPANKVPIDPTKRYVSRGWVKVTGKNRATADVKLHYYGEGGAYIGQTRIGFAVPGGDAWQRVTVTDRAADFPQAKFIGLAVACTGDAKALYDDLELLAFDKKSLPADFDEQYGVTRSPELAVLNRRVGTWTVSTKIKPCVWVPNGAENTGLETIRWTMGGQFLEFRQKVSDGSESMSLMTFDGRDRVYRTWYFNSHGNFPRSETTGRWDEPSQTLTLESDPKDEVRSVVRLKHLGDDAVEWTGVFKDKQGQVLLDIEGSTKRIKDVVK